MSQIRLNHAFKINSDTCPDYLKFHFQKLNENVNRIETRAKAYNFQVPSINTDTFAYSTIKDWNSLPENIKSIDNLKMFKEKVAKHFWEKSKKPIKIPYW